MNSKKVWFIVIIILIFVALWQGFARSRTKSNATILNAASSTQSSSSTPPSPAQTVPTPDYSHRMTIGDTELYVELPNTVEEQEHGLSDREPLIDTQGMLFDLRHSASSRPVFWMRDMQFDLDMIWIKNFVVVDITKNVPAPNPTTPPEQLPRYSPDADADMTLEVLSGWSDQHGIEVGDKVNLLN